MQKNTSIRYNNFEKTFLLNWSYNVGDIVEFGLKVCSLIIYNIKEVTLSNPATGKSCILGSDLSKFSSPIQSEYLTGGDTVVINFIDGPRNMAYIESYNTYLQEKTDMELAQQLQNEYNGNDDDDNTPHSYILNHFGGTLLVTFNLIEEGNDDGDGDDGDSEIDDNDDDDDDRMSISVISTLHSMASLESMGLLQDDVKVVLSKEELDKQRRILYGKYIKSKAYQKNSFKGSTCNICLDDFQEKDQIMILKKCAHYYHTDCIEKWLTENSNKCPVCKKTVCKGHPITK